MYLRSSEEEENRGRWNKQGILHREDEGKEHGSEEAHGESRDLRCGEPRRFGKIRWDNWANIEDSEYELTWGSNWLGWGDC